MPAAEHTRPAFLVTIDTEGDDAWGRRAEVTTRNAAFLPRFQELCERYGLKPTWLTAYEMAVDAGFQEFASDVLRRGAGELGMHLHAWHSPPEHRLTPEDHRFHPYLFEYPDEVMRAKIAYLTGLLEETFGRKMISHRAGRWGLDARYARMLAEAGYRVDCSVTPHVSWRSSGGDPRGRGGPDFRGFPDRPYLVHPDDPRRPGEGPLLEVPVTIVAERPLVRRLLPRRVADLRGVPRLLKSLSPLRWLRPDGCATAARLVGTARRWIDGGCDYAEFMLHSSELMPGGSRTFPDARSIEVLYEVLEELFAWAGTHCRGLTLEEYHARYTASHTPAARDLPAPGSRPRQAPG